MGLRVLVVDDHPAFRRLASRLLTAEGFDVVGEAGDGASALTRAAAIEPEVVLLDVLLPDLDGFAVAERLALLPHPPAVVLTSSRTRSDFGTRLERTSARGFVAKEDLTAAAVARLVLG